MNTKPRLSIVAPCFNEESNIAALAYDVARALSGMRGGYELVLVDDGSSDGTLEVIRELERSSHVIHAVTHTVNRGMFHAWQSGLSASSGEIACLIDADLQNPPGEILTLLDQYEDARADMIQGTRSSIERHKDGRYLASRGLNLLLNLAFGDNAQDNKSGFVLGSLPVLQQTLNFEKSYRFPQTFIRVSARSKGFTVRETETLFRPRRTGTSFLAQRPAWKTYMDVLRDFPSALAEFGRGQRNPTESFVRNATVDSPRLSDEGCRERVAKSIYFSTMPIHAWTIKSSVREYYEWLNKTQWVSPEEMRALQWERLSRIISHAYVHVPYYRRVMKDAGLHPRDIDSPEAFCMIPLLGKSQVRESLYMQLFSDTHNKAEMLKIATSGSTGEPFVTYADRQQLEVRFASSLRSLEWTGWRMGDRQMRLWHQRLGMSKSQYVREKIDAFMLRRAFVPAFEMTTPAMRQLMSRIDSYRPVLIDGYAESLNFMAAYLREGYKPAWRPSAVVSSAQMLTVGTRNEIQRHLGTEVFDKYGAREFSGIAFECSAHTGHHVLDESYLVEILSDGKPTLPGETGEVVITDLNNFSVPLIRYRIGDLAVALSEETPCPCGRGLSRIGEIQGRTQALVHCANGRWLPGTFFAHFFKDYDHIVAFFQVRQEQPSCFEIKIVKSHQWSSAQWEAMMKELRNYIGDTEVAINYVDEIPLLPTGKRTPVVSTLAIDFQSIANEGI